jgi:LuxR family maltose regulon positive regulatory protein
LSELHRERNDLDAATQHLLHSQEQGEHTGFPVSIHHFLSESVL